MLPKCCHGTGQQSKIGSVKPDFKSFGSFPLDRARRLTRYIVNDAIDILDLVHYTDRNFFENVVRDTGEIGGHEIGGGNAAES